MIARNTSTTGTSVMVSAFASLSSSVDHIYKIKVLPSDTTTNIYIRGTGYSVMTDGRIQEFTYVPSS